MKAYLAHTKPELVTGSTGGNDLGDGVRGGRHSLRTLSSMRRMRAVRFAIPLLVASCGGFLPFIGDDDDEAPPPPIADAGDGASDRTTTSDGSFVVVDGNVGRGDSSVACNPPKSECVEPSGCCAGLTCFATKCCVADGYANAADECCGGPGEFDGFRGWLCATPR